ncbi:hypothetical protein IW262DRAFT_1302385 [Armillaria fumosa]|nr:hypothetical protein IW262DRAFT_1302385 [Armillaria fumosa]
MVNPTGNNGHDCGIFQKQLSWLEAQHGYRIGKTKINELNNQFGIMSACKTGKVMLQSIVISLVVNKLEEDIHNQNGPDTIKDFLAQDGHVILRDMIHKGLKAHNAHGAAQHNPSKY